MINPINRRAILAATLATPWVSRASHAQADWPNRPIRWLVAFAAGGAADTAARSLAADMQEALGQNIVIENRTGGNAIIAANALLQAPRDGYTFLVDAANQLTNPALMRDIPFDYATAFTPTTLISVFPQVIAVKHDFPAKDIHEFMAVAKARPATITVGTPPEFVTEHLGKLATEAAKYGARDHGRLACMYAGHVLESGVGDSVEHVLHEERPCVAPTFPVELLGNAITCQLQ